MNRAYIFRIYPDRAQQELINKTFGCVRFIYNAMLEDKISYYNETGLSLNVTPASYKKQYEWLKEVDSLALCNAQRNLERAFKNFYNDKNTGFPKFKSKKHSRKSYTTNSVNKNIRIEKNLIILPKLKGVRMKIHRDIPDDHKIKSVTVSMNASGKYYASVLTEYEAVITVRDAYKSVGLDYSMSDLYISSDGHKGEYPKYYRASLEKLKRESRRLSKMEKGSRNREKQRIKIAKIHEKIANQRRDFMHKESRQIANVYDMVCVENLDMKAMAKALHFGKSVTDNSYGKFLSMLEYKLDEQGKVLVKVDRWYPSSKTCSHCGAVKRNLGLKERMYVCDECGAVIDRDYNASKNILAEGQRIAKSILL